MINTPQNPGQKTQDDRYSNQSNPVSKTGQQDREGSSTEEKNSDRNSTVQKDSNKSSDASNRGGMKNDPEGLSPRREREEEDRPRAGNK